MTHAFPTAPEHGSPLAIATDSVLPLLSSVQEESAQVNVAQLASDAESDAIPSPLGRELSSDSDSISVPSPCPPPPITIIPPPSNLPNLDHCVAAESSTPQGSHDGHLERDGDGGDGRRKLLNEHVATAPAEPRQAGTDSENDTVGNTLSLMNTGTVTEGQREPEGADGRKEEDSSATSGRGGGAADMQGNVPAPDSTGIDEEETGVSQEAIAGGLAGPSRQATPPPQTWGLFRYLNFGFWSTKE